MKNKKNLSADQIQSIVLDTAEKMEEVIDLLQDALNDNVGLEGGLQLTVTNEKGVIRYYMVTDMQRDDPYMQFYHLVSATDENISLASFPPKSEDERTRDYIKKLAKEPRWNRVYERIFIGDTLSLQTLGRFTYSKFLKNIENKANIVIPEGVVLNLPKKS